MLLPRFLLFTVSINDIDIAIEVHLNLLHALIHELLDAFVLIGKASIGPILHLVHDGVQDRCLESLLQVLLDRVELGHALHLGIHLLLEVTLQSLIKVIVSFFSRIFDLSDAGQSTVPNRLHVLELA